MYDDPIETEISCASLDWLAVDFLLDILIVNDLRITFKEREEADARGSRCVDGKCESQAAVKAKLKLELTLLHSSLS